MARIIPRTSPPLAKSMFWYFFRLLKVSPVLRTFASAK
jgi:hypothetical protein